MKIKNNTMITEATASTTPAAEKRIFLPGYTFGTPAQEEAAKALEKALIAAAENETMNLPDYEPASVDRTGTITIKGGRLTDTIGSYETVIDIHPDGTYSAGLRVCDITCNVNDDAGENSNRYWFNFNVPGEHNGNYCSGINNIDNMLWAIDTAIKTRVNEALTTASTINDLDAIKAQLAELNALLLWADGENIDIYRLWRPDDTRATMIEKLKAIRDGVVDKKPDGRLCTIDPQRVALCCLTCRQYGVNCSGMECKRDVGDSRCVYRLHNPDAPAPVDEYNRRVGKYHATATAEVDEVEDTTIKDYIDSRIASLRNEYGDYLTDLLVTGDIYDAETTDEVDAIIKRIEIAADPQTHDCYMIDTAEGYIVGDVYGIMSGNINGVETDDPIKIADALISHYGEDWRRDWISTKEEAKEYVYNKLIGSRSDTEPMYCTLCPYFRSCDLIRDSMLEIVSNENYPI